MNTFQAYIICPKYDLYIFLFINLFYTDIDVLVLSMYNAITFSIEHMCSKCIMHN